MRLVIICLFLAISAKSQITVATNTLPEFGMMAKGTNPYPQKVAIGGTGSTLSASCSGSGCTYVAWNFCTTGSSPCSTTTSAPAYIGIKIGDPFHATNSFNATAGTYPVVLTLTSASGCTGTCTISFDFHVYPNSYPTQTSPSGSFIGCSSSGGNYSPSGQLDVCTITNARPGGTWDMPGVGSWAVDPQFGVGQANGLPGTYMGLAASQRVVGGDAVTTQFNSNGTLVLTNILPGGTLLATYTDGSGDAYTSLPSGGNTWDPDNPSVFYYQSSNTIRKATLITPPSTVNTSAIYTYPGGTSKATYLQNGGDGGAIRGVDGTTGPLWAVFTYGSDGTVAPDTKIILLDLGTGTALATLTADLSNLPLLCPRNTDGGGYYNTIVSITNNGSGLARVQTTNAHGYTTGTDIYIESNSVSGYNGTWSVVNVDSTHFDIQANYTSDGSGGDAVKWAPRLITLAKSASLDGRLRMILGAYPKGNNYILSWKSGESTLTVDGPQAPSPRQVLGTDAAGNNSFYDGTTPTTAMCNAGWCEYAWHMDTFTGGDGDAYLLWPGAGLSYPSVVHQAASKLSNAANMSTPIDVLAGGGRVLGGMIDLGPVGNHDQHQGCAVHNVPVCIMDHDVDGGPPTAYKVSNATNANPIAITTTSAYGGANGDTLLINNVGGNTNANYTNALCTVGGLSGTTFNCTNLTGNGVYTASTGSLTKNVTPIMTDNYEAETWWWDFTNIASGAGGVTIHRMLKHRSWNYNDRIGGAYYGQPHSVLSMDGTKFVFASNGGIPDDYRVYYGLTGYSPLGSILGNVSILGNAVVSSGTILGNSVIIIK